MAVNTYRENTLYDDSMERRRSSVEKIVAEYITIAGGVRAMTENHEGENREMLIGMATRLPFTREDMSPEERKPDRREGGGTLHGGEEAAMPLLRGYTFAARMVAPADRGEKSEEVGAAMMRHTPGAQM